MKLTDGSKTIEITMMSWQGSGWSPDISKDFFNAGSLPFDEEKNVYTVPDVDYCIDQAEDWKYSRGDHYSDSPIDPDDLGVFVEEVEE